MSSAKKHNCSIIDVLRMILNVEIKLNQTIHSDVRIRRIINAATKNATRGKHAAEQRRRDLGVSISKH